MRRWVLAEFASEVSLLAAARRLRAEGFRRLDLHSPFPLPEAEAILELPPSPVGWLALAAGLGGAALVYLLQWYLNAVNWPLIVGSRPFHSAPAFLPITFELGVLAASGTIFVSLLALFGFPRVEHPVFRLDAFRSASIDGFWLSFDSDGDPDEAERAHRVLVSLEPRHLAFVEEPPP